MNRIISMIAAPLLVLFGMVACWGIIPAHGQSENGAAVAGTWTILEAGSETFKLNTRTGESFYFYRDDKGKYAYWVPVVEYQEKTEKVGKKIPILLAMEFAIGGESETIEDEEGNPVGLRLKDSFEDSAGVGLKPGDVIKKIHGTTISSLKAYDEWRSARKEIREDTWEIEIQRNGKTVYVSFDPSSEVPFSREHKED